MRDKDWMYFKKRPGRIPGGLTLLEVIISLAIALVAILTMLLFFAYSLDNIREGKTVAQATTVAQRYMEELRADVDTLQTKADSGETQEPEKVTETMYDPGTNNPIEYTVTVEVNRLPSPNEELIDIIVKVEWQYKSTKLRKIVLESYVKSKI